MYVNVLREVSPSRIEMTYTDAAGKKTQEVTMGYYDEKCCYFSLIINLNFLLPKVHSTAEIVFYSPNGVFKSTVKFISIEKTPGRVLFEVTVPQKWEFIQRRKYLRKVIPLPIKIKYDDGFEISTTVNDISAGGVGIFLKGNFSGIYQRLVADISIEFPEGSILHLPDHTVKTKANCIRVEENLPGHFGEKFIAYEFIDLDSEIVTGIRRFISMYEG